MGGAFFWYWHAVGSPAVMEELEPFGVRWGRGGVALPRLLGKGMVPRTPTDRPTDRHPAAAFVFAVSSLS